MRGVRGVGRQQLRAADDLIQTARAQDRELLTHGLGHPQHEAGDVLRQPAKPGSERRILRRDANGAGVLVAHAHQHTARRNQRRGAKPKELSAHQRGQEHIAPGLDLAVHLQLDPVAQAIGHEHLLRLGEAQLPRQAGVTNRAQRRRARTAARA